MKFYLHTARERNKMNKVDINNLEDILHLIEIYNNDIIIENNEYDDKGWIWDKEDKDRPTEDIHRGILVYNDYIE